MSWSFTKQGTPREVLDSLTKYCADCKCVEPEETIKSKVLDIASTALLVMPDDQIVKFEGFGSQSQCYKKSDNGQYDKVDGKFINNLSVRIEPVYNVKQ